MRKFLSTVLALLLLSPAPVAADDLPNILDARRIALTSNIDFPGGDLTPIFETDFDSCRAACLADTQCKAFTFNERSNACFPKTDALESLPFEGALSARVYDTSPEYLAAQSGRLAQLSFLRNEDADAARKLARDLPNFHLTGEWSAIALLDAARDARQSGAPLAALRFTGAALNITDDPRDWLAYAQLAVGLTGQNGRETRQWRERAISAGMNAFVRASSIDVQAGALSVMAIGLEGVGRGRDMIPALRLANAFLPRPETQSALEDAIARHGFRITEHRVDSDSSAPRVCAVFSEPLVAAGVDYAPFVQTVDSALAISHDDRQICVDGVNHGARYRLAFRAGLPAASGEVLSKTVPLEVYVRDRTPSLRFPGRGYVLPAGSEVALPIVTVNADTVNLRLSRVSDRNILTTMSDGSFAQPIPPWEESYFAENRAIEIWRGTGQVAGNLNQDTTTRLPLESETGTLEPGLYVLHARLDGVREDENAPASQWFVVSDLGVTTYQGTDGLHLYVRSLSDTGPKAGVAAQVVSRSNSILAEVMTGEDGYAVVEPALLQGEAGAAPALVTLRHQNDDFAFLSLTDPEFDLSDRGVSGRTSPPPIDVFLATDRGAYRAGETIQTTLLVRDTRASAVQDIPLTVILSRPDGVEYSRHLVQPFGAGGYVQALPIGSNAPRGTWSLAVHVDPDAPARVTRRVLVEDFLPERLDLTLSAPDGPLQPNSVFQLTAQADYLFGAPAPDLPLDGSIRLNASRQLDGFPGVRFGRHDTVATPRGAGLPFAETDAAGLASISVALPESPAPDRPVTATITMTINEGNGRPVERRITRTVAPVGDLLGIRPLFEDRAAEGTDAGFELVGLSRDLTPQDMQVSWVLSRIERDYQWYQLYGRWSWEPITRRTRVATGTASLIDGRASIATPVDWGRYELEVVRSDGAYLSASTLFSAGWVGDGDVTSTPDLLEVGLNKEAYQVGDTAQLRLTAPASGTALITVLSDGLVDRRVQSIAEGETTIDMPVTEAWGSGAYVTVSLLRAMDEDQGLQPARALGLAYAAVDPGEKRLAASFELPELFPAAGSISGALVVQNMPPNGQTYATVAAVDVGILNLTSFKSPDPEGHYFGQRALGVGLRDIYGRLIDGLQGSMGQVRSGGDAGAAMRLQAPPPTEKLAVAFSGPLIVGSDGRVPFDFDFDGFNGTVRFMAVVWSDEAVGQAEADVTLRDPVVLSASLPRFLAPGDESVLRLELTHVDGDAGRVPLVITSNGPVVADLMRLPSALEMVRNGREVVEIPIRARGEGDALLTVQLTTPDGTNVQRRLALGVRANDPEIRVSDRITLAPGATFTLDRNLLAEFKKGTGQIVLSAGPLARFDAPGLLAALDRYPWGCTEQIASRALPLLYVQPLAEAMGLDRDQSLSSRLQEAVDTMLSRQAANGSFGLWRAESGDLWLDAYVTDVLSRARAQSVSVPDRAFAMALDNLRNRVNYAADFERGGEAIAYALHVLAREGAASIGDLRYYADVKGGAFGTPLALAQLGSALAFYGDQPRADQLFGAANARILSARPEAPVWRSDYGTNRRDAAAVLALAVEAGSEAINRDALVSVSLTSPDIHRSTQESAWTMLAAQALLEGSSADLLINGIPADGPLVRVFEGDAFAPMEIQTASDRPETLVVTRFGVPEVAPAPGGDGYQIDRFYFTLEGERVQPDRVQAGTRMVAVLKVTPIGPREGRLMVVDPLPAGLEIDNPSLLSTGDIRDLEWLTLNANPANVEFRSDEFRAAVDQRGSNAFQLAYIVRAVSPGRFHHPAAHVEDMYRPQFRARGETGQIEVIR